MRHRTVLPIPYLAVLGLGVILTTAGAAAEGPVPVSPGGVSKLELIEARCPTFSWGQAVGAQTYELIVYRFSEEGEEALPVLRQSFGGAVSSWTPSLDRCLERAGRYAWSVRAVGKAGASDWSTPSMFEVAAGPSETELEEAMELVLRHLKGGAGSAAGGGFRAPALPPAGPDRSAPAATDESKSRVPATPTALSVDGSIDLDGAITQTGTRLIHTVGGGGNNFFAGLEAGNFALPAAAQNLTGVGGGVLANNDGGEANTAVGTLAMNSNVSGGANTAVGAWALRANIGGEENTALGYLALRNNTGSGNTALGDEAGMNLTDGSGNINIGANVSGPAGESQTIRIGNTQTATLVAGIHGTPLAGSNVVVTPGGQLGTGASGDRHRAGR